MTAHIYLHERGECITPKCREKTLVKQHKSNVHNAKRILIDDCKL